MKQDKDAGKVDINWALKACKRSKKQFEDSMQENKEIRAPTWDDYSGFPSQFKPKKAKEGEEPKKTGWIKRLFRR